MHELKAIYELVSSKPAGSRCSFILINKYCRCQNLIKVQNEQLQYLASIQPESVAFRLWK